MKVIEFIGRIASFCILILILLIGIDVLMRYVLDDSKVWVLELQWHLFGLSFLWGGAYAFTQNRHVRVDILYNRMPERTKQVFDIAAGLLLLVPWCLISIYMTWQYALTSFQILEGSPNPGGLPLRFIIKFSILLCFVLVLLAFFLKSFEAIKTIKQKTT